MMSFAAPTLHIARPAKGGHKFELIVLSAELLGSTCAVNDAFELLVFRVERGQLTTMLLHQGQETINDILR